MAKENKKSYWPHMIVGFLLVGITLGYWTVKSATSVPVQESNDYMMKYQQADMHINDILTKKAAFEKQYTISIVDVDTGVNRIENSKVAKNETSVLLKPGKNSFHYQVRKKDKSAVEDANVTFLLTRPHTDREDIVVENVTVENGIYKIENLSITKPGRYRLQLRVTIGEMVGYSDIPAYLKPE
jgi:hypothetical protein